MPVYIAPRFHKLFKKTAIFELNLAPNRRIESNAFSCVSVGFKKTNSFVYTLRVMKHLFLMYSSKLKSLSAGLLVSNTVKVICKHVHCLQVPWGESE